jgi:hypothetical protein
MLKIPITLLATVCFAACAFASQTVPQTYTLAPLTEPFQNQFTFSQFNPALGTLTGIEFFMSTSDTGSATVTNGTGSAGSYSYMNQSDLFISDLADTIFYNEALPTAPTQTGSQPSNSSQNLTASAAANASAIFNGSGAGPFTLSSYNGTGSPSSPIDSTSFIGTGNMSLIFSGNDSSSCTGTNITCATTASGGGSVTLTYDYTPATTNTPEPSTLGLLGSALLTLVYRRFRAV